MVKLSRTFSHLLCLSLCVCLSVCISLSVSLAISLSLSNLLRIYSYLMLMHVCVSCVSAMFMSEKSG